VTAVTANIREETDTYHRLLLHALIFTLEVGLLGSLKVIITTYTDRHTCIQTQTYRETD